MTSLMLLFHVLLALASLGYAGGVALATMRHKHEAAQDRTNVMWFATLSTIGTGVLLAFMTGSPIGRTCVTLLAFVGVVGAAHYYHRSHQKAACSRLDSSSVE